MHSQIQQGGHFIGPPSVPCTQSVSPLNLVNWLDSINGHEHDEALPHGLGARASRVRTYRQLMRQRVSRTVRILPIKLPKGHILNPECVNQFAKAIDMKKVTPSR